MKDKELTFEDVVEFASDHLREEIDKEILNTIKDEAMSDDKKPESVGLSFDSNMINAALAPFSLTVDETAGTKDGLAYIGPLTDQDKREFARMGAECMVRGIQNTVPIKLDKSIDGRAVRIQMQCLVVPVEKIPMLIERVGAIVIQSLAQQGKILDPASNPHLQ